jgi:hypothetical protein
MTKVRRCRESSRVFRDEADRPEIVVQGVDGVVRLEAASRFTGLRTQSSGAQVFLVLLVLGVGAVTGFMVWWRRLGADLIPLGMVAPASIFSPRALPSSSPPFPLLLSSSGRGLGYFPQGGSKHRVERGATFIGACARVRARGRAATVRRGCVAAPPPDRMQTSQGRKRHMVRLMSGSRSSVKRRGGRVAGLAGLV